MAPDATTQQEIQAQAGKLLTHVAGLVGTHTIEMGLRNGLIEALAKHPDGVDQATLAREANVDVFYTEVWCRAAFGAEVIEAAGEGQYRLAPHLDTLLLNEDFPGWIGGIFGIMVQPEIFDQFSAKLPSGEHTWWDQVSPDFIQGVANTSRPFYTRMLATGIAQVPGLAGRLNEGINVLELACGTSGGLSRFAQAYPNSTFVGLDGDQHSLDLAAEALRAAGVEDRVSLTLSTFEDLDHSDQYDLVWINVSMHECRDIERVTANVHNALKAGGQFVISDFPFPDSDEGLRTPPARVMTGIQFFEALIDDQLMPTQAFVDLLGRHGFQNVGSFDLARVHAVTHGQK